MPTLVGSIGLCWWAVYEKSVLCVTCAQNIKIGSHEKPNLKITTRAQIAKLIAESKISPIEAFGRGKLAIRGDIDLALRLFKHIALPKGRLSPC